MWEKWAKLVRFKHIRQHLLVVIVVLVVNFAIWLLIFIANDARWYNLHYFTLLLFSRQHTYLLSQLRLALLDSGNKHVTNTSSGQTVQTTTNAVHSNNVQVLGTWKYEFYTTLALFYIVCFIFFAHYLCCQRSSSQRLRANPARCGICLPRYHHVLNNEKHK